MEILAPNLLDTAAQAGASKLKGRISPKRSGRGWEMTRDQMVDMAEGRSVWMDIGCGDGRFAYRLARARHDLLVVGIDAAREPMSAIASRAVRPSKKHAAPNLILAVAGAEALPEELAGLACHITVLFPWGSLLRAIVLADPGVLENMRRLAAPSGAVLEILLNDSLYEQTHVYEKLGLVRLDEEHIRTHVVSGFKSCGFVSQKQGFRVLPNRELPYETTWGKRLADSHRDGFSWHLRFETPSS